MRAPKLTSIIFTLLLAIYPFIVYFGFNHISHKVTFLLILGLFVLRFGFSHLTQSPLGQGLKYVFIVMIFIMGLGFYRDQYQVVKYYPVVLNFFLAGTFIFSLSRVPIIELLARMKDGDIDPETTAYTRKITIIWILFFLLNGSAALYTSLYTSLETWTLYNGLISYLLIGTLLGGEYLFRLSFMKKRKLDEPS